MRRGWCSSWRVSYGGYGGGEEDGGWGEGSCGVGFEVCGWGGCRRGRGEEAVRGVMGVGGDEGCWVGEGEVRGLLGCGEVVWMYGIDCTA